jgi:hypothetical protein
MTIAEAAGTTRTIKVDALARVEGEGALHVRVKDGVVREVKFRIFVIFPRSGGHLSKLGMIRAEVMDGQHSTGIHG